LKTQYNPFCTCLHRRFLLVIRALLYVSTILAKTNKTSSMINNLIYSFPFPPLQCWLRWVKTYTHSALCHRWTIEHNVLDSTPNIVQREGILAILLIFGRCFIYLFAKIVASMPCMVIVFYSGSTNIWIVGTILYNKVLIIIIIFRYKHVIRLGTCEQTLRHLRTVYNLSVLV
jgi:hypothetical protein